MTTPPHKSRKTPTAEQSAGDRSTSFSVRYGASNTPRSTSRPATAREVENFHKLQAAEKQLRGVTKKADKLYVLQSMFPVPTKETP